MHSFIKYLFQVNAHQVLLADRCNVTFGFGNCHNMSSVCDASLL